MSLQIPMSFNLLSDTLPFCSLLTLLYPNFYSYYLHLFINIYGSSLPWSSSNSRTYRYPIQNFLTCFLVFHPHHVTQPRYFSTFYKSHYT